MAYANEDPSGTKSIDIGANASVLKPYSLGYAATNLEVGQTDLQVIPIEKLTHTDGEVTDHVETKTTSGVDSTGNNYSDNVDVGLSIKASWLSRNPWLKLPGLVRRGEEVQIWRVGDSDQFYWELLGLSNHLRRKDILLLVISNTSDESVKELTPQNSVMFEINTVDKHIVLNTPKNDGEFCSYTIQLSMRDGNFFISDDIGNSFVLDSSEEMLQLMNASNTHVKLDKDILTLNANTEININTKTLNVKTETTNMNGSTMNWKYSTSTMNGSNIDITYSNIGLNGAMTGNGNAAFGGGSLTHNGTNVGDGHTHNGVHGKTSGPQ